MHRLASKPLFAGLICLASALPASAVPVTYVNTGTFRSRDLPGTFEVHFTFDDSAMDDLLVTTDEIISAHATTYLSPYHRRGEPLPEVTTLYAYSNPTIENVSIPFTEDTWSRDGGSGLVVGGAAPTYFLANLGADGQASQTLELRTRGTVYEYRYDGAEVDGYRYGYSSAWTYRGVASVPGDNDGDGDVDDADLGTTIANFTGPVPGSGRTVAQGDTDGDGDIDDADLGNLIANFTGPMSPVAVPEPATAVLMALGLGLVRRGRRA